MWGCLYIRRVIIQRKAAATRNKSVEEPALPWQILKELNVVSRLEGREQHNDKEAGAGRWCISLEYQHRDQLLMLAFSSPLLPIRESMRCHYAKGNYCTWQMVGLSLHKLEIQSNTQAGHIPGEVFHWVKALGEIQDVPEGLGWPGNTLGSPCKSWRKCPGTMKSGLLCSNCCPMTRPQIRQQNMDLRVRAG